MTAQPVRAQEGGNQPWQQAGWRPWDSAEAILAPVKSTPWDSAQAEWRGRLVVGEYETGIFCPFCQIHDVAFDALQRRYPATVFLPLAYHYFDNIPLGDIADSTLEHMTAWYGFGSRGVLDSAEDGPDHWIDGKRNLPDGVVRDSTLGGGMYARLARAVDAELQRPPEAFFHVQTRVMGGQVQARVTVDSVVGHHRQTYLRLVLVEDTVSKLHPLYWYYQRTDTIAGFGHRALRREHHMVVRAVAHERGLPMGLRLAKMGTTSQTVTYTFDVAAIQRRALGYPARGASALRIYDPHTLADTAEFHMDQQLIHVFPDVQDWRIHPRRLHIVAFVQDAHTGDVLQAVMVPIAGEALQLP